MKRGLAIVFLSLLLASCAPSIRRIGYTQLVKEKATPCALTIVRELGQVDAGKKIGTMKIYDNGFSMGCSESEVMELIRQEGCNLGAATANLYNIKEPSFFGSSCFQTYVDFYGSTKDKDSTQVAATPGAMPSATTGAKNTPIDSIRQTGLEMAFKMGIGFVTSGNQRDQGLTPTPDYFDKSSFGLSTVYMVNPVIGDGIGYDLYTSTSAIKSNMKPLALFNEQTLRACIVLAPVAHNTPYRLFRWSVKAGLNYDILTLTDDYKNVIQNASGGTAVFYPGSAKGFGFYGGTDFSFIFPSGLLFGFGIGYELVTPKFKNATVTLDAKVIPITFYLGFRI